MGLLHKKGLVSNEDTAPRDLMLSEHYTVEEFNEFFEKFAELNTRRYRKNIELARFLLQDLSEGGYTGVLYM